MIINKPFTSPLLFVRSEVFVITFLTSLSECVIEIIFTVYKHTLKL